MIKLIVNNKSSLKHAFKKCRNIVSKNIDKFATIQNFIFWFDAKTQ